MDVRSICFGGDENVWVPSEPWPMAEECVPGSRQVQAPVYTALSAAGCWALGGRTAGGLSAPAPASASHLSDQRLL